MNRADLPTTGAFNEYDWQSVLPSDDADDWHASSVYSGTYSVHDGARVEDVTAERIARVDRMYATNDDGYADVDFVALVELTDATWAACVAWCDTTGWDCQSDVQWKWASTREDAISQGLDRDARAKLGVPLPTEVAA